MPDRPADMVRVVAAALRDEGTGLVCLVERPGRHASILYATGIAGMPKEVRFGMCQGFVTSDGRFVSREEAFQIAAEAGQIVEHHGPDGMLFSEDVW